MAIAASAANAWQEAFAAALRDPESPPPQTLRAWNGSDASKRFAVYRNNVAVGLVDALCDTFPVCFELVGEDFFRALAHVFVRQRLPQSRILYEFGAGFADFVAGFEPAREVPYLADVARLEYARVEAWHAADGDSMTVEGWSAIAQDRLGELRIAPHPSARVLSSPFAVYSLWAAHQGALDISTVDSCEPEDALVVRPVLDVETIALPPGGAVFFTALAEGKKLGQAAAEAAAREQFDLAANLAVLMQSGFAVAVAQEADPPAEGKETP